MEFGLPRVLVKEENSRKIIARVLRKKNHDVNCWKLYKAYPKLFNSKISSAPESFIVNLYFFVIIRLYQE